MLWPTQAPWKGCCCGRHALPRSLPFSSFLLQELPPAFSHLISVFFALARGLEGLCSEGEGNLAVVFLKGRWIYGLFLYFKKLEETVEEMTHRVRALAVKSKGPEFKTPSTHLKAWDYKVKTGGS